MVALSATAQSDGDVERIAEIVQDPFPRNGSAVAASVSFSRSMSAMIGLIR
jgi:hypothetical protein